MMWRARPVMSVQPGGEWLLSACTRRTVSSLASTRKPGPGRSRGGGVCRFEFKRGTGALGIARGGRRGQRRGGAAAGRAGRGSGGVGRARRKEHLGVRVRTAGGPRLGGRGPGRMPGLSGRPLVAQPEDGGVGRRARPGAAVMGGPGPWARGGGELTAGRERAEGGEITGGGRGGRGARVVGGRRGGGCRWGGQGGGGRAARRRLLLGRQPGRRGGGGVGGGHGGGRPGGMYCGRRTRTFSSGGFSPSRESRDSLHLE